MISYPRWKIVLVAIVVLAAILLALPNLFGEENALQLARDRAAVQEAKIVADKDIPHLSSALIDKYVTDLQLLGLL